MMIIPKELHIEPNIKSDNKDFNEFIESIEEIIIGERPALMNNVKMIRILHKGQGTTYYYPTKRSINISYRFDTAAFLNIKKDLKLFL